MKYIHAITLGLFVSCSATQSMVRIESLTPKKLREIFAGPYRKVFFVTGLATAVWLEKCPYDDNHLTPSHALDGYKHNNPFKQTFKIIKDVIIGSGHRYIPHPKIPFGYKPGYGILGSTWSGIRHTAEALHDIRRVKEDIEYWLTWIKNLRFSE